MAFCVYVDGKVSGGAGGGENIILLRGALAKCHHPSYGTCFCVRRNQKLPFCVLQLFIASALCSAQLFPWPRCVFAKIKKAEASDEREREGEIHYDPEIKMYKKSTIKMIYNHSSNQYQ